MKTPTAYRNSLLGIVAAAALTGCIHVHERTGLSYLLHTDYETFHFNEHPDIIVSRFTGYCVLPMEDPDDRRAQVAIDLLRHYLSAHGYVPVTKYELVAEPKLIPKTYMVGFGYHESYAYGTIQVQVNLYIFDREEGKNKMFWSWKGKFDGHPLEQRTLEPVLRDLFLTEPLDWGEHRPIFPRMNAPDAEVEEFMISLAEARRVLKDEQESKGQSGN